MWLPEVIFWGSLAGIGYTYQGYSQLLKLLATGRHTEISNPVNWPSVQVIFAAYNEEEVITSKLQSLNECDYPSNLLTVAVGSDSSTDATDSIVKKFAENSRIKIELVRFQARTGKAEIINQLAAASSADILICTDANIMHTPDSISKAVALLISDSGLGAVGGTLHYMVRSADGIAVQENFYRNWENAVRHRESMLWRLPMGLEGGFYAIRRTLYHPTPKNYFMEDFFQTMQLYCRGYRAYLHPDVVAYEDVSTQPDEEFQRKKRISIGNFQNLGHFFGCIHSNLVLAFVFWSHKGLRWITPILLFLGIFLSNIYLASFTDYKIYKISLAAIFLLIGMSLAGMITAKRKHKIALAVYVYHFFNMNFALLTGLIQYIKGVNTNVWQPTRRNQG